MFHQQQLPSLLLLLFTLLPSTHPHKPTIQTFTALTNPLPLHPGQITNSYHTISIPPGPIAVYSFSAEVVEKDPSNNNNIIPVPISDAYLHHHVIGSRHEHYASLKNTPSPMKPHGIYRAVGFGAGTESRNTLQTFPYPHAFLTIKGEDEWIANVHIINTRGMDRNHAYQCLECPCQSTNDDLTSLENTQKGWQHCNAQLLSEQNTACKMDTYLGGLRCCEEGEYCLDPQQQLDAKNGPVSTYYLRYTITYSKVVPELRGLSLAACCDASGDLRKEGNVEYDIPPCSFPGCVHTLSTIQMLHGEAGPNRFKEEFAASSEEEQERFVDVVFAVGHLHRSGMEISLYDDSTGELICQSRPTYGKTEGKVGDEKGYVVAMETCTFDPPRRMSTKTPIRVVSVYNATEGHTGVMGLFYVAIAEVEEGNEVEVEEEMAMSGGEMVERRGRSVRSVWVTGAVAVVIVVVFVVWRVTVRGDYSPIQRMDLHV